VINENDHVKTLTVPVNEHMISHMHKELCHL